MSQAPTCAKSVKSVPAFCAGSVPKTAPCAAARRRTGRRRSPQPKLFDELVLTFKREAKAAIHEAALFGAAGKTVSSLLLSSTSLRCCQQCDHPSGHRAAGIACHVSTTSRSSAISATGKSVTGPLRQVPQEGLLRPQRTEHEPGEDITWMIGALFGISSLFLQDGLTNPAQCHSRIPAIKTRAEFSPLGNTPSNDSGRPISLCGAEEPCSWCQMESVKCIFTGRGHAPARVIACAGCLHSGITGFCACGQGLPLLQGAQDGRGNVGLDESRLSTGVKPRIQSKELVGFERFTAPCQASTRIPCIACTGCIPCAGRRLSRDSGSCQEIAVPSATQPAATKKGQPGQALRAATWKSPPKST